MCGFAILLLLVILSIVVAFFVHRKKKLEEQRLITMSVEEVAEKDRRRQEKSDTHRALRIKIGWITSAVLVVVAILIFAVYLYISSNPTHGECGLYGDNLVWDYEEGVLTISGEGEMRDYCDIPFGYEGENEDYAGVAPWCIWAQEINEVIIEDGVTTIGKYAFCLYNVNNRGTSGGYTIERVSLPDSLEAIWEAAFDSAHIQRMKFPNGIKTIGDYAFRNSLFTRIEIPDSVNYIGRGAFQYCPNLKKIELPTGIREINHSIFMCCDDLQSVVIPDSVTEIGNYAFKECRSLSEIVIPGSVTAMGYEAFSDTGLREVTFLGCPPSLGTEYWDSSMYPAGYFSNVKATIYVPQNSGWNEEILAHMSYEADLQWGVYNPQSNLTFQPIS